MPDQQEQPAAPSSVSDVLRRINEGDREAADQLFPLVYEALHGMAHRHMQKQRPEHTLQATALVNEAYIKLMSGERANFENKGHFLSVASRAMRSILVDYARNKKCAKRDPGGERKSIDAMAALYEERATDLVALDEALERLAKVDPEMVRLVELRFFGGLTMTRVADILGISLRQAQREWQAARAWLRNDLGD